MNTWFNISLLPISKARARIRRNSISVRVVKKGRERKKKKKTWTTATEHKKGDDDRRQCFTQRKSSTRQGLLQLLYGCVECLQYNPRRSAGHLASSTAAGQKRLGYIVIFYDEIVSSFLTIYIRFDRGDGL